jgi:hypothetical protein
MTNIPDSSSNTQRYEGYVLPAENAAEMRFTRCELATLGGTPRVVAWKTQQMSQTY